jgi:hypothetical protein
LQRLFDYNPNTGDLTWKVGKRNGKTAGTRGQFGTNVVIGSVRSRTARNYKAHRIIWKLVCGVDPVETIDHINCDPFDNRLLNLRAASMSEQAYNQRVSKDNTSGYKGVSTKNGRFVAQINIGGKPVYLGLFDNPEEGHKLYTRLAKAIRGSFARNK